MRFPWKKSAPPNHLAAEQIDPDTLVNRVNGSIKASAGAITGSATLKLTGRKEDRRDFEIDIALNSILPDARPYKLSISRSKREGYSSFSSPFRKELNVQITTNNKATLAFAANERGLASSSSITIGTLSYPPDDTDPEAKRVFEYARAAYHEIRKDLDFKAPGLFNTAYVAELIPRCQNIESLL